MTRCRHVVRVHESIRLFPSTPLKSSPHELALHLLQSVDRGRKMDLGPSRPEILDTS